MVSKPITKKKTHKTVSQELLDSLKENDGVEEPGLNERAKETNDPQEIILLIRRHEDIIRIQNEKAIGYIGKQGQLLK